jgi:hypothetical protein
LPMKAKLLHIYAKILNIISKILLMKNKILHMKAKILCFCANSWYCNISRYNVTSYFDFGVCWLLLILWWQLI